MQGWCGILAVIEAFVIAGTPYFIMGLWVAVEALVTSCA